MTRNILALLLFILLTLFMTYPLFLHMHEAVEEPGDSLFIAWTVGWDINALLRDPLNIFHANVFYPHKYTLAYSEHMIGVSLLALPVWFFINNYLFVYNLMILLSFILCGFGGYILIYYLTRNAISGIAGGIIFAFCPYRFSQLGHLHVLTSQWMPFCLLFLHRITETRQRRILWYLLFGFFLFLQFLSSGHNGLYLSIAVGLFFLYFWKELKFYPWLAAGIVFILLVPFYYPYVYLGREFGFVRQPQEFELFSPQLSSYLAVSGKNLLYGRFLSRFCRPEAVMFPGVLALIFAFWGRIPKIRFRKKRTSWVKKIINVLIIADILIIMAIIFTGGLDLKKTILGMRLKVSDFSRPVYILLFLFFLKMAFNRKDVKRKIIDILKKITADRTTERFYWVLTILTFLLSFGPVIRAMDKDIIWGPYSLLYNFVPGFNGIRASGRLYNIFILALSVLAGFGVKRLFLSVKRMRYLLWGIPFILAAEYVSIPFNLLCRIGTNPPYVYKWLERQPDDFAVLEYPMPDWYDKLPHEIECMYWSLYHKKKIVNGYSGYSPPSYWPMADRMMNIPDEDTIEVIKYLGIKYVIVHKSLLKDWRWNDIEDKMGRYKDIFALRYKDDSDSIYEITDKNYSKYPEIKPIYISKDNWSIDTNCNPEDIGKAIDNDLSTRWHSGIMQEPDMFVKLDMGGTRKIQAVSMYFGNAPNDYPRGIKLEISMDGKQWKKIPIKFIYANYIKHLLEYPKDNRMILRFEPEEAGYIRLVQTGGNDSFFWSIYELDVM